jgi:hypothetical protein
MKPIKVLIESKIKTMRFNITPKIEKIQFYIDRFISSFTVWIEAFHEDKSLDTLQLNIRIWLSGKFDYYDTSVCRFLVRLFPKIAHVDSSLDTMRARVIRPAKLYEVNDLKLGDLNMTLGEFLFTEIE